MNFRLCFFLYAFLVLFKISNVIGGGGINGSPKNSGNTVATNGSLKKDFDDTLLDDEDEEGSGGEEDGSGLRPDDEDSHLAVTFSVDTPGGSKEKPLPVDPILTSTQTELPVQTFPPSLPPQPSPSPPPQESHPELPTNTITRTISEKQPTDGKVDQNNDSKNKNEITVRTGNTIEPFTPGDNGGHNDIGVHSVNNQDKDKTISFFAQPGILAAVIGGAVVGLLCAILVVMFIVYRMRKKDEGSYALEEMKRSPASNPYMKTNHREFFA